MGTPRSARNIQKYFRDRFVHEGNGEVLVLDCMDCLTAEGIVPPIFCLSENISHLMYHLSSAKNRKIVANRSAKTAPFARTMRPQPSFVQEGSEECQPKFGAVILQCGVMCLAAGVWILSLSLFLGLKIRIP